MLAVPNETKSHFVSLISPHNDFQTRNESSI